MTDSSMDVPVPLYDDLPEASPGYRCAWAYFNSLPWNQGRKDQLGTTLTPVLFKLNFLTDERRVQAAKEIVDGKSISFELPVDFFAADISAFGGRPAPVHTLKQVAPFACEDSLDFNTQSASQWDGFRHFAIRSSGKFYNDYMSSDFSDKDVLSIHAFLERGGICGRGVLIDFARWASSRGETVNVNSGRPIKLSEVLSILESQKTTIRPGDILVFRTGWLSWYQTTNAEERHTELCIRNKPGKHSFIGLSSDPDFVAWLWNNQIAAVAGDQVAFECTPPPDGGFGWLHEHLLACLGCPIGELWDTESVAKECEAKGRYTFFLASATLSVRGGAASTANAVAIM